MERNKRKKFVYLNFLCTLLICRNIYNAICFVKYLEGEFFAL